MRDIYELIRQKESDFERIKKELEALHMAARLLDDGSDSATRVVSAAPVNSGRDAQLYGAPPATRPTTTATPPVAWASAKQFP